MASALAAPLAWGGNRQLWADALPAKTIWGIAELFVWLLDRQRTTGRDAEDCLQAHLDVGVRNIIWSVGRSVVEYQSDIPNATMYVGDSRPQSKVIGASFENRCPLRTAVAFCHEHKMTLYARLCMNRHYGDSFGGGLRSRFASEHSELWEITRDKRPDRSRLSYFRPEYRQERLDILLETIRLGADGLCLDFARQPPLLRYHPEMVADYQKRKGVDAHSLQYGSPEFQEWCAYRCQFVTQFLRELRAALEPIEREQNRRIPVLARVTDAGREINIQEGIDWHAWVDEKLIDELATDPFWWLSIKYPDTVVPYVAKCQSAGIKVYAGLNTVAAHHTTLNAGAYLDRASRGYHEGADGIALYQSDDGLCNPTLKPLTALLADPAALNHRLQQLRQSEPWERDPKKTHFGLDNHSRIDSLGRKGSSPDIL